MIETAWPHDRTRRSGSNKPGLAGGNKWHSFKESFTTLDGLIWSGAGSTAVLDSGQARMTADTAYDWKLSTLPKKNLYGSWVQMKMTPTPAGADNTLDTIAILQVDGEDSSLQFYKGGTNMTCRVRTRGVNADSAPFAYSAVDHLYWRFEQSGGSVLFKTSPDKTTWTTRHSVANPAINLATMILAFAVAFWGTPGAGPFHAWVDDINI